MIFFIISFIFNLIFIRLCYSLQNKYVKLKDEYELIKDDYRKGYSKGVKDERKAIICLFSDSDTPEEFCNIFYDLYVK